MKLQRLLLALLLISLLSACGFHLRDEARVPASMQLLAIEGADALSPLGRDLRKALERTGVQIAEVSTPGAAVLRIGSNQFRTDVLSVGGNARANEYTIRYHVEFDVVDAAGFPLLARQTVELSRDFTFDVTQSLGVAAEQDLLTTELQRDMVQAVLRRLEATAGQAQP
jgi:LPS-assembly lipoprotein